MSHSKIVGSTASLRKVERCLISVSDKTGVVALGQFLESQGVEILSTGGTAKELRQNGIKVVDVKDFTGSEEILNGRVKTLHPKIHGALLAVRGNKGHEQEMKDNGIKPIDMVIVNLYPYEQTVAKGAEWLDTIENIDIGGPTMTRAAAKNHTYINIITSPAQYEQVIEEMTVNKGKTSIDLRQKLAATAFSLTAHYDSTIANHFSGELGTEAPTQNRTYIEQSQLKYGCNPQQKPAALLTIGTNSNLPFEVLGGTPGYINLLDAMNAWQLVKELKESLNLPAAASFKHCSPAGAAVFVELTKKEQVAYEITDDKLKSLTPQAVAYIRARNADPMSSFGDFSALSDKVDLATAMVLKTEVSDGIIAPDFTAEALEVLKKKKGGKFIVLKMNPNYIAPSIEYREVFGVAFSQKRNDAKITYDSLTKVVTKNTKIPDSAKRDLIVAEIALKYTQSNSVGYAINGQMIGVGAGQQSRVDCVKLAARKVKTWWLRQHDKVTGLDFKKEIKRQARINARVRYIEGDFTAIEYKQWLLNFNSAPEPLTDKEKDLFLGHLKDVCLGSDAFFPFRDGIDVASIYGVTYIAQPGGSVKDEEVIAACADYGIAMCMGLPRLFHH